MTVSKTRKGFINSMHKYVYLFSEGNGSMRELLGGKGANLAEMTNLGMPVPQGFTISTEGWPHPISGAVSGHSAGPAEGR